MRGIGLGRSLSNVLSDARVNSSRHVLETESDETLEQIAKASFKSAAERDANGIPFSPVSIVTAPDLYFEGMAAMRLLEERHGQDYTLGLMGYRKPQTFAEKVGHLFTGQFPVAYTKT